MKKLKTVFATALFAFVFSAGAYAQNSAKVLAVVNSASWCSVCKSNGERAMGAFMENNKDGQIQFVMNDLSNAETTKKSAAEVKKVELTKAMENYKASGVVYFFDAKTKKPITQITVANSNEEIAHLIAEIKKAVK